MRLPQPDPEAAVLGEVEAGVVALKHVFVQVTFGDERLHDAVQDLARHAAECRGGALITAKQRGQLILPMNSTYLMLEVEVAFA